MKTSEVAKKLNVPVHDLMYWERIGIVDKIKRNKNGYRDYDDNNLKQINFVICMRKIGMKITDLKRYMDLFKLGPNTSNERKQILVSQINNIDTQISLLKQTKMELQYKVDHYDKLGNINCN